jgi:hypothetical protein
MDRTDIMDQILVITNQQSLADETYLESLENMSNDELLEELLALEHEQTKDMSQQEIDYYLDVDLQ